MQSEGERERERERDSFSDEQLLHTSEFSLPVSVKLSEAMPFGLRVTNLSSSLSESKSAPE